MRISSPKETKMIQTWLPLPSFRDSVKCLSNEHLTAQRQHVLEIMEYNHQPETSQLSVLYEGHDLDDRHPVILMWKGYDLQLTEYGLEACEEWALRIKGTTDPEADPLYSKLMKHLDWATTEDALMHKPNWFGDVDFHLSHQAELLREDKKHYSQFFTIDADTAEREMIWPKSNYRATS